MASGTVKWFDTKKGYGFIVADDGGPDVFVHVKAVQAAGLDTLAEKERVNYTIKRGHKGKQAAEDLSLA